MSEKIAKQIRRKARQEASRKIAELSLFMNSMPLPNRIHSAWRLVIGRL